MSNEKAVIKTLPDHAIKEIDKDGLGFEIYAKALSGVIRGTKESIVTGIFGEWGSGKTSLMQLVQSELKNDPYTITIWFNAWMYEKDEHPIIPLIATIIRELEKYANVSNQLSGAFHSLVNALRAVAYGFSGSSKIKIPGLAEIEASFVAKDMVDRSDKLSFDPLLERSLYYSAFEKLGEAKTDKRLKIVIFIDDLDRCFPDNAVKLLESLKLVLSQNGFVFVMGVARSVIEGYLKYVYSKEYGIGDFESRLYLDKIIQLPFYIPPHKGRMEKFWLLLLENLDSQTKKEFEQLQHILYAAVGSNPRATIRFVNNLIIDRFINAELSRRDNLQIIPIGFFAITRSLEQRYYPVYQALIASDDLCKLIASSKNDNEKLDAITTSGTEQEKIIASALLKFPDLQQLLFSNHGNSWLQDHQMRKTAIEFLEVQRAQDVEQAASEILDFLREAGWGVEEESQAVTPSLLERLPRRRPTTNG